MWWFYQIYFYAESHLFNSHWNQYYRTNISIQSVEKNVKYYKNMLSV